jgi:hypothetical protein
MPKTSKIPGSKATVGCPKKGPSKSAKKGVTKPAPKKKPLSLRKKYLGATPGKASKTGRAVIERMSKETPPKGGRIKYHPKTGEATHFYEISDGKWYPLKSADMGHVHDAVVYWNATGRKHGAKSAVVRKWMLDSKNYRLEHFSLNRSKGAILGQTANYQKPLK